MALSEQETIEHFQVHLRCEVGRQRSIWFCLQKVDPVADPQAFAFEIGRVGACVSNLDLLRLLEQIVTREGLVEFRPRIDALVSRLEDDSFELALFGRVSCGKSSLLNALLGTDVLSIGINPVTAVPTKLRYGPTLKAVVAYGDGRSTAVSVQELSRLVTEQGNPGNLKNSVCAQFCSSLSREFHLSFQLCPTCQPRPLGH